MTDWLQQRVYQPDIFILVGIGHFYFGLTNTVKRLDRLPGLG